MNKAQKEFWTGLAELRREIGRITNGWGRFVEGIIAPSAIKTFSQMGYKVSDEYHRRKIMRDGKVIAEYDTVLVCATDKNKVLIIGEAKSHFTSVDVKNFIADLDKVKEYFREYKEYEVIGFVASTNYDKGADKLAENSGLYVFKPSGEAMVLDVRKGFKPKKWK